MVITDAALRTEKSLPALNAENVKVKQGKSFLSVVQVIPAQGDNAALQLMILIDDTLNTEAVGNNLNDLTAFIGAQPPSTVIGVAAASGRLPHAGCAGCPLPAVFFSAHCQFCQLTGSGE